MKILKKLLLVILILPLPIVSLQAGQSDDGIQRLALQVSDNDPKTLNKVLNVAANFARRAKFAATFKTLLRVCLLYTSPSPRDGLLSRMPSSA